jgi:hypothetical protein
MVFEGGGCGFFSIKEPSSSSFDRMVLLYSSIVN